MNGLMMAQWLSMGFGLGLVVGLGWAWLIPGAAGHSQSPQDRRD